MTEQLVCTIFTVLLNKTKHIQPSAGMYTQLSVRTDSNRLLNRHH